LREVIKILHGHIRDLLLFFGLLREISLQHFLLKALVLLLFPSWNTHGDVGAIASFDLLANVAIKVRVLRLDVIID
jgi:hypothetical protein